MIKNFFYFILKAFFVLKIFKNLSSLFGHVAKNGLIRNIRLTSKSMTSKPGQETIVILPNISRSKDNQRMNFGQLIEYNKRKKFSVEPMLKIRQGE